MSTNIALMVDEVKSSLERMELLLRDRYTAMIANMFERITETLRREIKTGFASMTFAQSTTDLHTLVESLSRFSGDMESFTNIVGIQIQLNEFSSRLASIDKQLSRIADTIGLEKFDEESLQEEAAEKKLDVQTTAPERSMKALKDTLDELYAYIRWKTDPPDEMKKKSDIVGTLDIAKEKIEAVDGREFSVSLRNQIQEFLRINGEIKKNIIVSSQGTFNAEDLIEIAAPLARKLKHLLREIDA
ncbi:MAG: hypothetical protein ACE5OZ_08415 [Candidatus Heimdallarchaeota archaeon]